MCKGWVHSYLALEELPVVAYSNIYHKEIPKCLGIVTKESLRGNIKGPHLKNIYRTYVAILEIITSNINIIVLTPYSIYWEISSLPI